MNDSTGSWGEGPLVAFDLETTATDPHRDRIVTASVVTITPRGDGPPSVRTRTWLADPGVEIPPDATAIHGISTEHARAQGRPAAEVVAEVVDHLAAVWRPDVALCVFNAVFDLTMLDAESSRHLDRPLALTGPVLDPLCVDRHLRPVRDFTDRRRLSDVCAHYGVRLEGAHTSDGDALAAARVAWKLARVHASEIGFLTLAELHDRQAAWHRAHEEEYALRLERKLTDRLARSGESEQTEEWRARVDRIREAGRHWPLTPDLGPVRPPRRSGPANANAPWTPALEAELRESWLATDPAETPETARKTLATHFARSPTAIRARLLRLGCDPEAPGRTCDPARAAELKRRYEAEYPRD
ncbi:hypothetical protein GCM10022243_34060 [Saccharothrix violaceirubra]|uniref:DNA polymerase-3 subunit epsilon n=1 Tax=Saccharothrix violaceirubra TaxID=413306 RepID=A0A7W7T4K9_9PSEU|nr:exonuclease domain-containing protein [Saccharothrix violaceirubra]MBB4966459.1 DNA polymerase-3 subunit epsilon [Saccharothrix violaceirubra]